MKWVKTSEQLPTKEDDYVVINNSTILIAYFDGEEFVNDIEIDISDIGEIPFYTWETVSVETLYWLDWEGEKYPKDFAEYKKRIAVENK